MIKKMIDKKLRISKISITGIIIIISFVYTLNIQPIVSGTDNTIIPIPYNSYSNYLTFFNSYENFPDLFKNTGFNQNYSTSPVIMHLIILSGSSITGNASLYNINIIYDGS
jgi:hypothetical protein